MADVHHEDVARHRHRYAGLLRVEQAEGRRDAEGPQQVADKEATVLDEFRQVAFQDREDQQAEDGGEEDGDGPSARVGRECGHGAPRAGSGGPAHGYSTLPLLAKWSLKATGNG